METAVLPLSSCSLSTSSRVGGSESGERERGSDERNERKDERKDAAAAAPRPRPVMHTHSPAACTDGRFRCALHQHAQRTTPSPPKTHRMTAVTANRQLTLCCSPAVSPFFLPAACSTRVTGDTTTTTTTYLFWFSLFIRPHPHSLPFHSSFSARKKEEQQQKERGKVV